MSGSASNSVAAVAAALAPKHGMQRIPIPLESYQHPSLPLSAKRLLNFYAEQQPNDARTAAALISTGGLVATEFTFGTGPILAMNSQYQGAYYLVSGERAYRMSLIDVMGSVTTDDLGFVGTATGDDFAWNLFPSIAVGVNAAVICVPPNAYTCSHGGLLHQIGGDFPGASSVAYLDGYFVFTPNEVGGPFFCSLLLDADGYDALDFAYADGVPNVLHRVLTVNSELWFLGDGAVEVWYNAGSSGLETTPGISFFPFRRRAGAVIEYGAASPKSAAVADRSLFWVAPSGMVLRSQGYQSARVSTHAIESIILGNTAADITDAFSYSQYGHEFYCLTVGGRTLVYDCNTKVWHERSSSSDGSGPWLPTEVWQVGEILIFGTRASGATYYLTPGADTDANTPVFRQIILPPIWANTRRAFCSRVEIELETGGTVPPGDITLIWSDDDAKSFAGGARVMSGGVTAGFRGRLATTRLGSFRSRIFAIHATHRVTLYGVDAEIVPGNT